MRTSGRKEMCVPTFFFCFREKVEDEDLVGLSFCVTLILTIYYGASREANLAT